MKRSEILTIMGIALLSAVLFMSTGQLSWAAPAQLPHMQTVPPRPPDDEGEPPPAPPEEPAPAPNEPPAEDSPTQSDDGDNNGGSSGSQNTPQEEPVAEPTDEPAAAVSEEAPAQPETSQEEPPAETGATTVDQESGPGATADPVEAGTTNEATVEDNTAGIVEEPEAAIADPQNSRSQNVAFEEKVSAISQEASAEASAETVPGEVAAPEASGFPLYWLIVLGVGLALIAAGTVIMKRA